jgi:hypothetical protein
MADLIVDDDRLVVGVAMTVCSTEGGQHSVSRCDGHLALDQAKPLILEGTPVRAENKLAKVTSTTVDG